MTRGLHRWRHLQPEALTNEKALYLYSRPRKAKLPRFLRNARQLLLWDERELPNAGMVPHGVSERQRIAAAHLGVGLMTGGEVEEAERIADPFRLCRQARAADDTHDPVMKDNPVWFL